MSQTLQTPPHLLNRVIVDICKCLSGDWELTLFPDDYARGGGTLRNHELAATIVISESYPYGRLHIKGYLPKDAKGQEPYMGLGRKLPEINVSLNNSNTQIAKAIERRLMPEYMPLLLEARIKISQSDAYHSKVESFAEQLAKTVGGRVKDNKVFFSDGLSNITVRDEDVTLELNVNHEDALHICKFLNKQ